MNSYRGAGTRITKTVPTGGVTAGSMSALRTGASGKIGVWVDDYSAGATGVLATCGVHEVTCAAIAISQGDALYFDSADAEVNKSATGNTYAGTCVATKATTAGELVLMLVNDMPG